MPDISTYINVDVDIPVDDFLEQCDEYDIEEIIEYLKENHSEKLNAESKSVFNGQPGLVYETQKKLFELGEHAYKFTESEESFLQDLYKKYL